MGSVSKPWYLSKMVWINLLAIIAAVIPATSGIIQEHFAVAAPIWGVVNVVLRLVTKDKLELF